MSITVSNNYTTVVKYVTCVMYKIYKLVDSVNNI